MFSLHLAFMLHFLAPHFSFPRSPIANEEIMLRWIHFVAGIIWIGLLYFFNLVGFSTMKQLDGSVRGKVFPVLMTRAMWWFRWSALVTVLVGLRYYYLILAADAENAGDPALALHWLGWWLLVWILAYALIYPFQLPMKALLGGAAAWVRTIAIIIIVIAASWAVLALNRGQRVSNAHLSISVGGGLGLLMLLNAWGVVWRAQKRLIAWTRASAEHGMPMPPEAERLASWAFIASRVAFWLSFPMLFFMGAAEHYPLLSGMIR